MLLPVGASPSAGRMIEPRFRCPGLARLDAIARVPVVVTCRPERSSMLFDTYGFEGSEADIRATGAVCAPFLSPAAARVVLLACLGAGLDRDAIGEAFAPWDAAAG